MGLNDRWILPEGIDEALPERALRLETLRRELLDLYASWGYDLVIPPMIEYLESLLIGSGSQLDLQTFKLTDQLSGRTLGLRADMTPQVARIDANRLQQPGATRLCYIGTVLNARSDGLGGSRSPIQVGAELYGHAGLASDREILKLVMETFAVCEIADIHVDLGHAGVFRQVSAQAGLSREQAETLFEMLQRKAVPEIETWLAALELTPEARKALAALAMLNGGKDTLAQARGLLAFAGATVRQHLDTLENLGDMLEQGYPGVTVNFDLAEVRGYSYETGVVFAAYVPGEGREILRGGRYDGVGEQFGRSRPAVGFSADLKRLLRLSGRRFSERGGLIWAPAVEEVALQQAVADLREKGERVVSALDGQSSPEEAGCTRRLVNQGGQWVVEEIE